jgi:hypothetical protein
MQMRHLKIWLFLAALIVIFGTCILAGMPDQTIFRNAPPEVAAVPPIVEPAATATTAAQPTIAAAAEETEAPTEAPLETEVAVVEQVDYCLECHTDKDQLIDTAAPEEEVVEESEGAG